MQAPVGHSNSSSPLSSRLQPQEHISSSHQLCVQAEEAALLPAATHFLPQQPAVQHLPSSEPAQELMGCSMSLAGHLTKILLFLLSPPTTVLVCISSSLWLHVLPREEAVPAHGAGVGTHTGMSWSGADSWRQNCSVRQHKPFALYYILRLNNLLHGLHPSRKKTQNKSTAPILQTPPYVASQDWIVLRLHLTKALHQ